MAVSLGPSMRKCRLPPAGSTQTRGRRGRWTTTSPSPSPQPFLFFFLLLLAQCCHAARTTAASSSSTDSEEAHKHMSPSELRRIFQIEEHENVPEYELVRIHSVSSKSKRDDSNNSNPDRRRRRRVRLETRDRRVDLRLSRVEHLVPSRSRSGSEQGHRKARGQRQQQQDEDKGGSREGKRLRAWFADGFPENVSYTPTPDDEEDLGDVYQDEVNQAALLLYRDRQDDALLMDGTIGDDLVVKPLSADTRRILEERGLAPKGYQEEEDLDLEGSESLLARYLDDNSYRPARRRTDENDDYAFLDEDEDIDDEDVMVHAWGRRKRRDADEEEEEDEEEEIRTDLHVIFRRRDAHLNHASDYHFMETDHYPTSPSRPRRSESALEDDDDGDDHVLLSRKKRQAPYIIFPEILCIVDYDGYRLHGKDNIAIKRYVISFWNGIDLRYKLLKGPSVKISIAGIIISRGRDATPYLERNRVGRDAIDSASALTDMGKYLFLERRLPVYDIAVAITKLDMCRRKSRIGECNRGTAGFAYVGGACVVNKRLEKVNSVAIVEDTGGFSGIIVAAHELGHLLGAVHDGSPPPSYLGGPGARKCRWEDGFIMSDLRHTSKGFRWSLCTVKQFHHFLNGETATCMYNSPHEEESLPRVLPGKLLSLDAQCRKDRGTSACFKDDRVCAQLFCFDAGSGYCVSYRPAAEGSRCGDGYLCLNGKCVREHENAVDFSGDGFLRRSGDVQQEVKVKHNKNKSSRKWWSSLASKATTTTTKAPKKARPATTTTESPATTKSTRTPWWKRLQRPRAPRKLRPPKISTPVTTTTSSPVTTTTTNAISSITTTLTPEDDDSATVTASSFSSPTSTTTTSSFLPTTNTTPRPKTDRKQPAAGRDKGDADAAGGGKRKTAGKSSSSSRRRGGGGGGHSHERDSVVSKPSSNRSVNVKAADESGECEDRIDNLAGSLSCSDFLRSFAYQYCRHKYIRRNCCASHAVFCRKRKGGRPGRPGDRNRSSRPRA